MSSKKNEQSNPFLLGICRQKFCKVELMVVIVPVLFYNP